MSCSLVNINHLVFSVPEYVPSSAKRNCLVESKTEGDSGHWCVSLFPSMSENQSCKQQSNKAFNCPQPLFNEQIFMTKWLALSLMTQLAFHARGDSNDTPKISTVTTTGISDAKSELSAGGSGADFIYGKRGFQPCAVT